MVQANRLHMQKALLNLIQNGVESMAAAGESSPAITVSVRAERKEGMVQITIRDIGPGFKPGGFEHLFKPFFSAKRGGFAMGLTISRSLIEANGGQLWIDPEASGATVHLTLPFAVAD
jgi:C4-dicarboxylate-specific signal transduction histidine kinase